MLLKFSEIRGMGHFAACGPWTPGVDSCVFVYNRYRRQGGRVPPGAVQVDGATREPPGRQHVGVEKLLHKVSHNRINDHVGNGFFHEPLLRS